MVLEKKGWFEKLGNELVWRTTTAHKLEDTGCIFLAHNAEDEAHRIYKLQKNANASTFTWYGLWNTCVLTGSKNTYGRWEHEFATIEAAVMALLDRGFDVRRCTFDDLARLPHLFTTKP